MSDTEKDEPAEPDLPDMDIWSCPVCSANFDTKTLVLEHVRATHYKKGNFPCAFCDKLFLCRSRLKHHEVIHDDVKKYECGQCPKTFYYEHNLKTHQRVHAGVKEFSCQYCGQMFLRKGNLVTHERTHTREKPYACTKCDKRFSQKVSLKNHEASHEKNGDKIGGGAVAGKKGGGGGAPGAEKKLECRHCDKKFRNPNNLLQHEKVHKKALVCTECNLTMESNDHMEKHKQWHRWHGGKKVVCDQCGTRFHTDKKLEIHRAKYHDNARPLQCPICNKRFKIKSHLEQHERLHDATIKFQCGHCPKAFTQKCGLIKHTQKSHAAAIEYKHLPDPKKGLSADQNHLDSNHHDGNRIYACASCSKKFKVKSNLVQHERIHIKELHYRCEHCPKTFPQKNAYKNHMKSRHPDQEPHDFPPELKPADLKHPKASSSNSDQHNYQMEYEKQVIMECPHTQKLDIELPASGNGPAGNEVLNAGPLSWANLWNLTHCQINNQPMY